MKIIIRRLVSLVIIVAIIGLTTSQALQRSGDVITAIDFAYNNITKTVGSSFQISYSLSPSSANSNAIVWKSSNESVATVSGTGIVICKGVGSATITAISTQSVVSASCVVNVVNATNTPIKPTAPKKISVDQVLINRTLMQLVKGDSVYLKAEVLPTNATNKGIKWTSSDNAIVTVDSNGLVIAQGVGEATISASDYQADKQMSCKVIVMSLVSEENKVVFTEERLPFQDITQNDVNYESVYFVYQSGIMKGLSSTNFSPDVPVTRAMLATVLYRIEDEPDTIMTKQFSDIDWSDWFARPVMWASQMGIANGVSKSVFAPNTALTREQLATLLYRYANLKNVKTDLYYFIDNVTDINEISEWSTDAVKWAVRNKLLSIQNGRLYPKQQATRADVARALYVFKSEIHIDN